MQEQYFTPKETAQRLKISTRTLDRRRKAGLIKSSTDGARRFYSEKAINEYLSNERKEN